MIDVVRGLFGLLILVGIGWACSNNRQRVNWTLVASGIGLQVLIALALKLFWLRKVFEALSTFFIRLMDFTREGSEFLFGGLVTNTDSFGYIFAFQVLPTIVFISALSSALYYLNILQKIVFAFAWIMNKTMRLSGAESLAAAANIFVGQTEAPLMIKPYVNKMTRSEIMCLMSGGMATVAGGVFIAYVSMLGGNDPEAQKLFGQHLLMASIISAPAAIVAAKLMIPETEAIDQRLFVPRSEMGSNVLDAIANGTTEGIKLAVNVAGMLLVFIALVALVNFILEDVIGHYTRLNEVIARASNGRYEGFSLQCLLGVLGAPIAWIIGVPNGDLLAIGQLLGTKTVLNEFVAYMDLAAMKDSGQLTDMKSILIATYALCGFANFSSIGIQIGGIGVLAPDRRHVLAAMGIRSLVGGTLACLMTACVAGMLY